MLDKNIALLLQDFQGGAKKKKLKKGEVNTVLDEIWFKKFFRKTTKSKLKLEETPKKQAMLIELHGVRGITTIANLESWVNSHNVIPFFADYDSDIPIQKDKVFHKKSIPVLVVFGLGKDLKYYKEMDFSPDSEAVKIPENSVIQEATKNGYHLNICNAPSKLKIDSVYKIVNGKFTKITSLENVYPEGFEAMSKEDLSKLIKSIKKMV